MEHNAHITEEALLAGCKANDRRCQEQLYRQFFPAMYRMCSRYSDHEDEILEILNAGFLRVFTKIDSYAATGSLEGWIRKLIFHSVADYFRQRDKKVQFLTLETWDGPEAEKASDGLFCEDILGLVDRLPAATREVFWLFAVEGYTHQEIGQRLGISPGTSKWHLSSARQRLKEWLNKDYSYYAG